MTPRQVVLRAYERAIQTRHPLAWVGVEHAVMIWLGPKALGQLVVSGLAAFRGYLLAAEAKDRRESGYEAAA
jgi:hypothetical protein